MAKIVGVRFRNGGKVYYFDPKDLELKKGSYAIVETARGVECGRVVFSTREVDDQKLVSPLRPVIRVAGDADIEHEKENRQKEKEAYRICRQKIRDHHLEMKLVQAECTFDNKKMLFYFTADGRVDFRDLVKDLASVFRTRIELRQIGVRDETKMLGGIGSCGRPLCCSTYLSDFAPVSIKMAKEQNLSLNPSKISGVCGRLMCCLKNEEETYEYLNQKLPGVGDIVQTPDGQEGVVQSLNVLRQRVRVLIEEGDNKEAVDCAADEITLIQKHRKGSGKPSKESAESGKKDENGGTAASAARRERDGREQRDRQRKNTDRDVQSAGESGADGSDTRNPAESGERRSRRNRRSRRGGRDQKTGAENERLQPRENAEAITRGETAEMPAAGRGAGRETSRPRRRDRRRPDRGRADAQEQKKES